MENNTVSVPGRPSVVKTTTKPQDGANLTSHTTATDFAKVKHLLSEKPLRSPARRKKGQESSPA
jgi:hypothetical protein